MRRTASKFTYVEFGDDNAVRVGDWVVAVGNPFGLGGSVTAGIVSASGRDIGAGPYDDFLQIDAAVNRGNSGGPAFNLEGQVIGINTAIFSPSGGNVGIAFAIPASVAKDVVQSLKQNGSVERGWLGVQIAAGHRRHRRRGRPRRGQGRDRHAAGQRDPGVEGRHRDRRRDHGGRRRYRVRSARTRPQGRRTTARARPSTSPCGATTPPRTSRSRSAISPSSTRRLRLTSKGTGAPVNPSSLSGYGLTVTPSEDGAGVVITDVDPDSTAADKGMQAGDIDRRGQRQYREPARTRSARPLSDAAKSGRKAALFQLKNGEQNRFVALPVAKS